jgi:hypothetical protein
VAATEGNGRTAPGVGSASITVQVTSGAAAAGRTVRAGAVVAAGVAGTSGCGEQEAASGRAIIAKSNSNKVFAGMRILY